jgi:glycosyltransferase involved in cell wall biosynthesis
VTCRVHRPQSPIRLGWIGVEDNLIYLRQLDKVFESLYARYGDRVELNIVSSRPIETPLPTTFQPWSLETEDASVLTFDIGLMPLTDDPFSRGKCAFKAVYCMSRGIPVVASPVGANKALIQPGINGFLPATPQEWLRSLGTLIEDSELRARLGAKAREEIAMHYSADEVARVLPKLVSSAATRRSSVEARHGEASWHELPLVRPAKSTLDTHGPTCSHE